MFIIKSNKKNEPNWSGKEFSREACKIYSTYDDASDAIKHYWYGGWNLGKSDNRHIIFVPLTEEGKNVLLEHKKIRW